MKIICTKQKQAELFTYNVVQFNVNYISNVSGENMHDSLIKGTQTILFENRNMIANSS